MMFFAFSCCSRYLCLKRYEHARACFTLYAVNKTARSVKVSDGSFVSVYDDAFLNFCQLLLLAIQHGKPGLFLQLKSRYLASLCEYYEDAKKVLFIIENWKYKLKPSI